jgi:DNA-binding transcriptional MerR regulator
MNKDPDAFRTISEAAAELDLPQHVLRFWETRFPQVKPLKRAGGRRYYRPRDIEVLRAIKHLLYKEGYTIRGVQRVLKEQHSGAVPVITEVAAEDAGFPDPAAQDESLLRDCQLAENERGECSPHEEVYSASGQPVAESRSLPDQDGEARKGGQGFTSALALTTEDVRRLRSALAEIEACENILDAARRQ